MPNETQQILQDLEDIIHEANILSTTSVTGFNAFRLGNSRYLNHLDRDHKDLAVAHKTKEARIFLNLELPKLVTRHS